MSLPISVRKPGINEAVDRGAGGNPWVSDTCILTSGGIDTYQWNRCKFKKKLSMPPQQLCVRITSQTDQKNIHVSVWLHVDYRSRRSKYSMYLRDVHTWASADF
jgi:hypothetical protein